MTPARLSADLYALTHRGTVGDAAFYGRACAGAERVLELGVGYGRMLTTLAQAGRSVVGLDLDRELLAAAKRQVSRLSKAERRLVRLVRGDMRAFDLGRRFDRVLLPFNGLYCLLSKRDALACLRATRSALVLGGRFLFDVWNATEFSRTPIARTSEAGSEAIVTFRHGGYTWDVHEHLRGGRASQRLNVVYDYVPREAGTPVRIPIAQRYYLPAELGDLLTLAGFVVERRYGDFSEARFTPRSPHLIVCARAV